MKRKEKRKKRKDRKIALAVQRIFKIASNELYFLQALLDTRDQPV